MAHYMTPLIAFMIADRLKLLIAVVANHFLFTVSFVLLHTQYRILKTSHLIPLVQFPALLLFLHKLSEKIQNQILHSIAHQVLSRICFLMTIRVLTVIFNVKDLLNRAVEQAGQTILLIYAVNNFIRCQMYEQHATHQTSSNCLLLFTQKVT